MSRCASFWHKFEQEGNFCGMDPAEISRIKAYLEFVGKLEKTGLEKDFVFTHFSSGAARPLMSLDDETKLKGLNYVAACLKREEKVTSNDLKESIKAWRGSCSTDARSEKLTNVKKEPQTEPEIKKEPVILHPNLGAQTLKDRIPDTPPRPKPAPCLSGGGCPDLNYHLDKSNKLKGTCCDILNIPINQLPGSERECPLDTKERLKGTKPEGFHPASLGGATYLIKSPYIIKPVAVSKAQAEDWLAAIVKGYLTPKSQNDVAMLLGTGELGETYVDLFQELINEAAGRMGA